MRELKPGTPVFVTDPDGQRVRATVWDGRLEDIGDTELHGRVEVVTDNGWWLGRDMAEVEVRKPDIPREHLRDLYLAANKQLAMLQAEGEERARVELAHFAEALRVLLEGEVRDGE